MGKLLRFEFTKMLKDPRYIIVFILFFVITVYDIFGLTLIGEIEYPEACAFIHNEAFDYFPEPEKYEQAQNLIKAKDFDGFLKFDIENKKQTRSNTDLEIIANEEYSLKNNVEPQVSSGSEKGLFVIGQIANEFFGYLFLLIIFIGAIAFSKEYSGGAVKLLCVQPFSRTKIFFSKYLSSVIFTFAMVIAPLLVIVILNCIFFNFHDPNYPVFLRNNYLQLSKFSEYSSGTVVPLWYYAILTATLLILMILAFNAISFFFSVAFKHRVAALCAILLISTAFLVLINRNLISAAPYNPFSVTFTTCLLQQMNYGRRPIIHPATFMDGVVSFTSYTVVFLLASFVIMKHKKIEA